MADEPIQTPEPAPAPAPEASAPPVTPEQEMDEMTTLHERTIAALSYVGFLCIVPFYLKKESKFCRFHGKQGMMITIIFFFAKLLIILNFFNDLVLLLQFTIFVWMGFNALSGRWKKMPFIYDMSCQLEEVLSLKSKDEEANMEALKPDQVQAEQPPIDTK